jgi:1-acyl-sn-glycerol-3-phosphate acyltransferase
LFRKKAIDEWALNYWLLQQYARLCFRIYYRKIEIVNRDRIRSGQPVILAPNHQNALMDAMVLVCNMPFQSVFLARADIFKGKRMVKFLTYLNIMPVFRIRDGIENVKKNDEVFEKTTRVLHNGDNPLVLFAEGSHGNRRRLRPVVKGLFRIAFQAQEKYGNRDGVKIIPVGIDYGHYQNFRTTLFVNVGEPVEISEMYLEYAENPVAAINHLKEIFAGKLSKLMIDIQTEEFYALYMDLRAIFNDTMRQLLDIADESLQGRFKADKFMIECLNKELDESPEIIHNLNVMVPKYKKELRNAGIRDWVLNKQPFGVTGLLLSVMAKIVLLPVFVFGILNNFVPYWFASSKVSNIKDQQFHSSFKYVIGMIVFPVWYLVTAGILAFLSLPIWTIILYILLLPLTGLVAFEYYIRFRKLLGKLNFTFRRKSGEISSLIEQRKKIISLMTEIIKRQNNRHENPR